jgi:hypothetical protein
LNIIKSIGDNIHTLEELIRKCIFGSLAYFNMFGSNFILSFQISIHLFDNSCSSCTFRFSKMFFSK